MRAVALLLSTLAVLAQGRRELQEDGVVTAILNGRNPERGRYNYVASLRYPWRGDAGSGVRPSQFVCQGVLIRPDMVLTTAWCVVNSGVWPIVRLASYETNGGPAEVRRVVATAWHSAYTGASDDVADDVAVMLLDRASSVQPVKLPPASYDPAARDDKLVIAGWGLTKDDPEAVAPHLMTASQFLLRPEQCAAKWSFGGAPVQAGGWGSGKMVCGAYAGHVKALCWGDGGAPLVRRGATSAQDLVVGLGSQSACKGYGVQGGSIFANAAHYHGWIQNSIRMLRRNVGSYGEWQVARAANFPPPQNTTCKAVGRRCSEGNPAECCSGTCFIWTCMP